MKKITSLFLLPILSCLFQPGPLFAYAVPALETSAVPSEPLNIFRSSIDAGQLKAALQRYVNPSFAANSSETQQFFSGMTEFNILGRGRFVKAIDRVTGNYQLYRLNSQYQIEGLSEFGNKILKVELSFLERNSEKVPVYKITSAKDRQLLQVYERLENGGVGRILRIRNLVLSQPVDKEFYYGVSASDKPVVSIFDYLKGSYLEIEFEQAQASQSYFKSQELDNPSLPIAIFSPKSQKDFAKQILASVHLTPVLLYLGNLLEEQDFFKLSLILAEDDGRGPPALEPNVFSSQGVR